MTSNTNLGRRFVAAIAAAVLMLQLVATALVFFAPPAAAADLESVVDALRTTNIYVEEGARPGDVTVMESAVQEAAERGMDLRIAVLADDDRINSQELVDALGSVTAIVYTPTTWQIESTPGTFDGGRFDEVIAASDSDLNRSTPAVGVGAFVDRAIEGLDEGESFQTQTATSSTGWWWWLIVGLAVLGVLALMMFMLRSSRKSKAQSREREEFEQRRVTLRDWAKNLRQPVTELQQPVAAARSTSLAAMYNDALKIARESDADLTKAATLPELDRVEIRVAKAWMQIRDIRKALDLAD